MICFGKHAQMLIDLYLAFIELWWPLMSNYHSIWQSRMKYEIVSKNAYMGTISNLGLFVYLQWPLMISNNLWGQIGIVFVTINDLWGKSNLTYDGHGCHMVINVEFVILSTFPKVDLDWPLFDIFWPLVTSKVRM